jgi:DNA polymerase III subunit gamma/tau
MSHEAFARKYRPRTFGEVVGQEAIATALRGAVHSGQLASVYLFSGSHGVGKTSMARILAKSLNCPNKREGDPCLECPTCVSIDTGEALDVIEIDAASNRSIDDARRIRENVLYRPQAAPFKVYILDEAHQLTSHAWDALLKTFEEAPEHARFVMATTELHKIPTTIRSRAQVFHFRRATRTDVERRLQQICEAEGVGIAAEALSLVVRRSRGSMRDAQKMLDQVVTLGAEGETIEVADVARLLGAFTTERVERLLGAISRGEAAPLLAEVSSHAIEGGQTTTFIDELTDALRAALYVQTCGKDSPLLDDFGYQPSSLVEVSEALSAEGLLLALAYLVEAEQKLKLAREPRVLLEVVLVRLARARELRPLGEVLERLERLEARLGGGNPLPPGGPPRGGGGGGRGGPQAPPGGPPPAGRGAEFAGQQSGGPRAQAGAGSGARGQQGGPERARSFGGPGTQDRAPQPAQARAPQARAPQARVDGRPQGPPPGATAVMAPPRPGRQSYAYPDHMRADAPPSARPPEVRQQAPTQQAPTQQAPPQQAPPQQAPPQQPPRQQPPSGPSGFQPQQRERPPAQGQPQQRERPPAQAQESAPPSAGGHLSQPAVEAAWNQIQGSLGEALGIAAEALGAGQPLVEVKGPSAIELSVCLASFSWRSLNNDRYAGRIAELLSSVLGRPIQLTLARREGQPQMNAAAPGARTAGNPLYDHPLVKLAQRELDARRVM